MLVDVDGMLLRLDSVVYVVVCEESPKRYLVGLAGGKEVSILGDVRVCIKKLMVAQSVGGGGPYR